MQKINGMRLFSIFLIVLISGCDNKQVAANNNGIRDMSTSYDLDQDKTAWLRDHLPDETLAYINVPTPWNYLFDAKADALHAVQSLPGHKQQVADIKQGIKDNYYQYVPVEAQGVVSLLLEHVATSVEVALINYSESAMLPTVAIGTRLEGMTADQVADQLTQVLVMIDPNIELVRPNQDPQWTFKVNMFPAFVRFDQSTGRLLMFGGMAANN